MGKHLGVGLMSGTSLDGIDAVLVEIEGLSANIKVKTIESITQPYDKQIRKELMDLCSPSTASLEAICSMNMYLGEKFGQAVNNLLNKANIKKEEVLFISSHGQTIFHKPQGGEGIANVPGTLQIGDLSVLSEVTGIATVGDFRTADMAAGGQGAPLVSFVDYILFKNDKYSRAIQNIGGIGNVTYIPKNSYENQVQSFDTGPGNMVIDEVISRITDGAHTFDKDGKIAYKGNINKELLKTLMDHPYLSQLPPKTTGREEFGSFFVDNIMDLSKNLSNEDIVATVTAWTAKTISQSYTHFLEKQGHQIDEVVIGGGGSYNPFLIDQIKTNMPNQRVYLHEDFGISSDLKESVAFAILGYQCLHGQYNQIPSATGAQNQVVMGKIAYTQPDAFERVLSLRGNKE